MKKVALITGVTGQDGSYLSRFLLNKNYVVHGIKRRSSSFNTERVDGIYKDPKLDRTNFFLHYGELTDSMNIYNLINQIKPDEIYNLAAQSHVKVSFETPEYTANSDALGTLRILEAIKVMGLQSKTKFYQASTSEMYGDTKDVPQSEETPFKPQSPYGTSKLFAYWITKNYRDAYKIFACNGILFNHESPLRGETFVTQKIIQAVVRIKLNLQDKLLIGNLDALRDWGHAKDYVEGMWKIMQHEKPDDFVLATGKAYSVRTFIEKAFKLIDIEIVWKGKGVDEIGLNKYNEKVLISVEKSYFRPNEVNHLLGNFKKAKDKLNWSPTIEIDELISEMYEIEHYNMSRLNTPKREPEF